MKFLVKHNLRPVLTLGLFHVHTTSVFSIGSPLALTSSHGIPLFLSGIGVGMGSVSRALSTSPLVSAINSEVTSNTVKNTFEPGVTPIENAGQINAKNIWHEITLPSMHEANFWELFVEYILNYLTPGITYGCLIQPSSKVQRLTLGTSFHLTSDSPIELIKEHFIPILNTLEEDYNEEFNNDTRIKIASLSGVNVPPTKGGASRVKGGAIKGGAILEAIKARY